MGRLSLGGARLQGLPDAELLLRALRAVGRDLVVVGQERLPALSSLVRVLASFLADERA